MVNVCAISLVYYDTSTKKVSEEVLSGRLQLVFRLISWIATVLRQTLRSAEITRARETRDALISQSSQASKGVARLYTGFVDGLRPVIVWSGFRCGSG